VEAALLLGVLLLLPTLVIFGLGFTVNALLLAVGVTLAVWAVAMAMRAPGAAGAAAPEATGEPRRESPPTEHQRGRCAEFRHGHRDIHDPHPSSF
jgi:hypothetical protein